MRGARGAGEPTGDRGGVAMRAVLRAWERVWFEPVDGLRFALVRVACAAAALTVWLGTAPALPRYYADSGEFPISEARAWVPFEGAGLLLPDFMGSLAAATLVFAALGASLVCLLAGYRTATAALLAWLLLSWLHLRNPTFLNGGDEVVRITLFHMAVGWWAVAPGRRALSIDAARARREAGSMTHRPDAMPAWPLRLLQIQVCLLYAVAGGWKLLGTSWWDGSVVYYALGNPYLTRFGIPDWPWSQPLFATLTVAVAWWELLFPLLVWHRRTVLPALAFGVLVHGLIFVTMNIGVFSFAMLATYPAFLPPDVARRWVGRLVERRAVDAPVRAARGALRGA